jgi:hypothetical protein
MEVLFSYGKPVAVLRAPSKVGRTPIYHTEFTESHTTRAHIEKFANGRDMQSWPANTFRIMYLLDLATHFEAEALGIMKNSVPEEGTPPPPSGGKGVRET